MRGHTKFLGGFEKIEGARLSGGLLLRVVIKSPKNFTKYWLIAPAEFFLRH